MSARANMHQCAHTQRSTEMSTRPWTHNDFQKHPVASNLPFPAAAESTESGAALEGGTAGTQNAELCGGVKDGIAGEMSMAATALFALSLLPCLAPPVAACPACLLSAACAFAIWQMRSARCAVSASLRATGVRCQNEFHK